MHVQKHHSIMLKNKRCLTTSCVSGLFEKCVRSWKYIYSSVFSSYLRGWSYNVIIHDNKFIKEIFSYLNNWMSLYNSVYRWTSTYI